jgi:hypothetical protein
MGPKETTQMARKARLVGTTWAICVSVAPGLKQGQWSLIHRRPAMHPTAQTTRLLPRQTRMIDASAGMRLRVVSGHFWLTQPNAAQDLFLGPGASIDLLQDWILIGADAGPRPAADAPSCYSEYLLMPLVEPLPRQGWSVAVWRAWRRWARQAAAATRNAWPSAVAK